MNMMKGNKPAKIALLGSYPPPYGGVSVHIERLKYELRKRGIECVVYDFSGEPNDVSVDNVVVVRNPKTWLFKYIFTAKENIIHVHTSDWRLRAVIGLMGLIGKRTIISIHGESLNKSLRKGNWLVRQTIKFALKSSSFIIALNTDIEQLCLSLGVKSDRVKVIPSFIPPNIKGEEIAEIPKQVWDLMGSHSPVVSANAFRIRFHNNQDLYGIDMCIDLCANLKRDYPEIGFVFCLPDIGDYEYINKMKQRIVEKGINNNFLFVTQPYQFYPILMKSDVFVRPTNTEGDAISIREALYFKIPAVASDVVPRPEGTLLFKNREFNDFTLKVKDILDNYERYKKKLEVVKLENNFEKIIEVYQQLNGYTGKEL